MRRSGSTSTKTGVAPDAQDAGSGRGARHRDREHVVAGPDAERVERERDRVGAARARDGERGLAESRPLALERRDLVAENVTPTPHAREKRRLERFSLLRGRPRKLEERHGLRRHGRGLSQLSSTLTSEDGCATSRGVSRVT